MTQTPPLPCRGSMGVYEAAIAPVKEQLFTQLLAEGPLAAGGSSGDGGGKELRILEVGIGTGEFCSGVAPHALILVPCPQPAGSPLASLSACAAAYCTPLPRTQPHTLASTFTRAQGPTCPTWPKRWAPAAWLPSPSPASTPTRRCSATAARQPRRRGWPSASWHWCRATRRRCRLATASLTPLSSRWCAAGCAALPVSQRKPWLGCQGPC